MKNFFDKQIIQIGLDELEGIDLDFFQRIWKKDLNIYISRIKSIGFLDGKKVLDAGCGFGQWSVSLSRLNNKIYSVDNSKNRIQVFKKIIDLLGVKNITAIKGSISNLKFKDNFFDSIFCYSSIYFTDYKKTLKEFKRVLKPGGKIYISTNGLGWYIHNIVDGHNSTSYFDSRKMAIDTIANTLIYNEKGIKEKNTQLVMPSNILLEYMNKIGLKDILMADDGKLNLNKNIKTKSFYPKSYFETEGVYEVLAWKK